MSPIVAATPISGPEIQIIWGFFGDPDLNRKGASGFCEKPVKFVKVKSTDFVVHYYSATL